MGAAVYNEVSRTITPPLSLQRVSQTTCRRCVTCISICYRRYAAHIASSTSAQPRARLRSLCKPTRAGRVSRTRLDDSCGFMRAQVDESPAFAQAMKAKTPASPPLHSDMSQIEIKEIAADSALRAASRALLLPEHVALEYRLAPLPVAAEGPSTRLQLCSPRGAAGVTSPHVSTSQFGRPGERRLQSRSLHR